MAILCMHNTVGCHKFKRMLYMTVMRVYGFMYVSIYYCVYIFCCSNKCIIPFLLMVCTIFCDFNPFLLRQVITHSAMQVQANSRATTRNSIAIVLHAGCTAAASSVKC